LLQLPGGARLKHARHALVAALRAYLRIATVVLPTYVAVVLFKHSPLLPWTVERMAPLMSAFGLPGEAALVLVLGMSINIYAAIAACAGLALTAGQATTIALVLGFAHNLFVESAVLLRLTPRGPVWIALRIAAGVVAGLVFGPWFAALLPGAALATPGGPSGPGAGAPTLAHDLVVGGARSMLLIALVSIPIVFALEVARLHGLLARLRRPLAPVVRALGIDERGTEALLAGLFFGMVYGAGVIVSRIEEEGLPRPQVDRICIALVLCHAIIEDTLLFAPVGAVLWPVALVRVAVATGALFALRAARPVREAPSPTPG
jgi:spore maturation protein SpmB